MRSSAFALIILLAGLLPTDAAELRPKPLLVLANKAIADPYSQAALQALRRLAQEQHFDFRYVVSQDAISTRAALAEDVVRPLLKDGFWPVIFVGPNQVNIVRLMAASSPEIPFAVVDEVVAAPNVESVIFRVNEGSFLAGMAAALKTRTGRIGFIGGLDIPAIRAFECGYLAGARHADPRVVALSLFDLPGPAAFANRVGGEQMARRLLAAGADVVFTAAGLTGRSSLDVISDAGAFAIGVDVDQNGIHPGHVLTSMEKRFEPVLAALLEDAKAGHWQGSKTLTVGLREQAVGLSMDEHNAGLLTAPVQARIEQARADIASGVLNVVDLDSAGRCPIDSIAPGE